MQKSFLLITISILFSISIKAQQPKNIILLIGDGMGITHIQINKELNNGISIFDKFPYTGLSRTASADNKVTDSGAGGTALATGQKTNNLKIGVDTLNKPLTNLIELAYLNKKATGIVVTCDITHATPASFIAHVPSRYEDENIATYYLKNNLNFFMGSGQKFFTTRTDKRNLLSELTKQSFNIITEQTEPDTALRSSKIGWFIPGTGCEDSLRPFYLSKGVAWSIQNLNQNKNGFFMMVEASQIDWAGHENNFPCLHRQMNEFEQAIEIALQFAKTNKNTLIIVTADHETGGLTIQGSYKNITHSSIIFTTKDHTGTPVGVFAYGPGAELFSGYYENTEIFNKIKKLAKF